MLHPLTDEGVGHRHSYAEGALGVAGTWSLSVPEVCADLDAVTQSSQAQSFPWVVGHLFFARFFV